MSIALVGLVGCGSTQGTGSTQTASTIPPAPSANASRYLTPPGYAALRDVVAFENARHAATTSPSAATAAISKLRKTCAHLGYDPANPQVQAVRAQCQAATDEASTYQTLAKCRQAAQPAARRACVVQKLRQLSAIVRREHNLDDRLLAGVAAGPCRNLLLLGYAGDARLANASDQIADAVQTAKTASDLTGPLQTWQRAVTSRFANAKREPPLLKRQLPACRAR